MNVYVLIFYEWYVSLNLNLLDKAKRHFLITYILALDKSLYNIVQEAMNGIKKLTNIKLQPLNKLYMHGLFKYWLMKCK